MRYKPIIGLPLLAILALSACTNITPAQQALLDTAITTGVTLATQAAANNTTAQKIIDGGALLCALPGGPAAVAGVNVTGVAATSIADVCAGLGGRPTALPVGVAAASVPVVVGTGVVLRPAG